MNCPDCGANLDSCWHRGEPGPAWTYRFYSGHKHSRARGGGATGAGDGGEMNCPDCGANLDSCWHCGEPGPAWTSRFYSGHKHSFPCGGYSIKNLDGSGEMGLGIGCYRRLLKQSKANCVVLRQALYYMAGRLLDAQGRGPSTYSSLSAWHRGVHRVVHWITRTALRDTRFRAKIEAQMGWRFDQAKAECAAELENEESPHA